MRGLIVDNFAGGGGASTGIEQATGRPVDIAINHDPHAIAMHTKNHPRTLRYCESVFEVDPIAATAGRPVDFAWFSPDCTHYSKARGAKPVKREIRGLAWITLRWGLKKRPKVMALENVEEFKTWGPLLAGEMRPDPTRSGETFNAFVGMLSTGISADHPALQECCEFLRIDPEGEEAARLIAGLGYTVEFRELRACDYGAPTIRKRFFMVMRRDGLPVRWPTATHGDPKSDSVKNGLLLPWRTAADCIDWSIPCPSIFDRKKPLAVNTQKRIARGIQRFVVDCASPFIVKCNHTSTRTNYDCFRGQGLGEPLHTITKKHCFAVAIPRITPFIAGNGGSEYQAKPRPITKPHYTILKHSRACVVAPIIVRQFGKSIAHRADAPLGTITAGGGGNYSGAGISLDEPAHTVTTTDHHALITSHLVKFRGTCRDERRADQVSAFLREYGISEFVTIKGVIYRIVDIGMRMLQPRELYRAQGFPEWYVIDRDADGNRYAKDKQVARCGNAVPPPFAEALVRANLPELCISQEVAA